MYKVFRFFSQLSFVFGFVTHSEGTNVYRVSGGDSNPPFYQFTDSSGNMEDFSVVKLIPGHTYKFIADGISTSHPFMIGESQNDMNSSLVTGNPLIDSTGEIVMTIPNGYTGNLFYFCTLHHETMSQVFQIASSNSYTVTNNFSFIFFENQYYKLSNPNHGLFISDAVGSDTILNNVFPSRHITNSEYLLFNPSHNSPRLNYYFDPNDLDFNGTIQVLPYVESEFIVSNELAEDDFFGYSILFNDWNETLISAPDKNSGEGAIYIFEQTLSNEVVQSSSLQPEPGDEGWWGSSMYSDGNFLFVGAPNADNLAGKIIVYNRDNGSYIKRSEIIDPKEGANDSFGYLIKSQISSNRLIASPITSADRTGRLEVFSLGNDGNWTHQQTLWSEDNSSGNFFGSDFEIGDNFLVVGAPKENNQKGQVYIYSQNQEGLWSIDQTLQISENLSPSDEFGHSIAMNENFIFVGSKNWNSDSIDAGAVLIFNKQNDSWSEVARILPADPKNNQLFSWNLESMDDLLIVTSLNVSDGGKAYVYKMFEDNASDWRLISSIDNNASSVSNRTLLSLGVSKGKIALGSPEYSNPENFGGSVKVFYNEGWQELNAMPLEPLFADGTPNSLPDILEDSNYSVNHSFLVEHPFVNNFQWSVSSDTAPVDTYSISPEGNFSYLPESNFSGVHNFSINVETPDSFSTHEFSISVTDVNDAPVFSPLQSTVLEPVWVGEFFSRSIEVFDADGDDVTISADGLISGMSISRNDINGTISDDAFLNGALFKDLEFTLTLSDNTGTHEPSKSFEIRIYARNSPPAFTDENSTPISSLNLELEEDFNQSEWLATIGTIQFEDDQNVTGFSLFETINAKNGSVELNASSSTPIIYSAHDNYHGDDNFSVTLHDASEPSKSSVLFISLTISPVNDPPVIDSSLVEVASEGIPFSYLVEWSDIDGDLGHLVSVENLPNWLEYNSSSHLITGMPQSADYKEEPYLVNLTVTDLSGASDSEILVVEVIPVNYPPAFYQEGDITITVSEDLHPIIWNPLALRVYDLDGSDSLFAWSIEQPPLHGTYSLEEYESGAYLNYIPDSNFTGSDSMVIKVYDPLDTNASDSLNVSILVDSQEDDPVISPYAKYTDAVVGNNWTFTFEGIDGDANQSVEIENLGIPSWMTFSYVGDEVNVVTLAGVPTDNDIGSGLVRLLLTDNFGSSNNVVFEVEVLAENFKPQITRAGSQQSSFEVSLVEDQYWENLYPLVGYDENKQELSWTILESPQNGVFVMDINDGEITELNYTPNADFAGMDLVTLALSDGIDESLFTYNFSVIGVDDSPTVTSDQNAEIFNLVDGEPFVQEIKFMDVDMDLSDYNITGVPAWIEVHDDSFHQGEIRLSGIPSEQDRNITSIEFTVFDEKGLFDQISFDVNVTVENFGPVLSYISHFVELQEDQPLTKVGDFNVTDEDQSSGHTWTLLVPPENGLAELEPHGGNQKLFYKPDGNFSGQDQMKIRVTDLGGKYDEYDVNLSISSRPDSPIIVSKPIEQLFEDQNFSYLLTVKDGDLDNGNEEELTISTLALPSWLSVEQQSPGVAHVYGKGNVTDAGFHFVSFEVIDSSGDSVKQDFFFNLIVRDYPPVFKSSVTGTILEQVIINTNEDQTFKNWVNPQSFLAINPDREFDDFKEINWSVATPPISGAFLSVSGEGGKPSEFVYTPPPNFFGSDFFSLNMDEGDRISELEFEVIVSPVPDKPSFISPVVNFYEVQSGEFFELDVEVKDIDSDLLEFNLKGASWDFDSWLKLTDSNVTGITKLEGVAQTNSNGNEFPFSLTVTDETGLVAVYPFTIKVTEKNFAPIITPNAIDVQFNSKGLLLSDIKRMSAIDKNGDLIEWSLLEGFEPSFGTLSVEGTGSLPSNLKYFPRSTHKSEDSFKLIASDGLSYDTIQVNTKIVWERGLTVTGDLEDFTIYEGQEFTKSFYFHPENGLDDVEILNKNFPDWVNVERVNSNNFQILGTAPLGQLGTFEIKFSAKGLQTDTCEIEINLSVLEIEESEWLYNKVDFENGWSYHFEFGWIFLKNVSSNSVWMWKDGWGWLWSENNLWNDKGEGYFYREDLASWIFWTPKPSRSGYNVYDFETGLWMKL